MTRLESVTQMRTRKGYAQCKHPQLKLVHILSVQCAPLQQLPESTFFSGCPYTILSLKVAVSKELHPLVRITSSRPQYTCKVQTFLRIWDGKAIAKTGLERLEFQSRSLCGSLSWPTYIATYTGTTVYVARQPFRKQYNLVAA